MKNTIFAPIHCPRGEIGRHASLRGWCLQWCAGSNPVVGTIIDAILLLINEIYFLFHHAHIPTKLLVEGLMLGTFQLSYHMKCEGSLT